MLDLVERFASRSLGERREAMKADLRNYVSDMLTNSGIIAAL